MFRTWASRHRLACCGLLAHRLERRAVVDPAPGTARDRAFAPGRACGHGAHGGVGGIEKDLLAADAPPAEGAVADELEGALLEALLIELAVGGAEPVLAVYTRDSTAQHATAQRIAAQPYVRQNESAQQAWA